MPLIDRVKARTGSDLPEEELHAMIDAITTEIEARHGPAGPITEILGDALVQAVCHCIIEGHAVD